MALNSSNDSNTKNTSNNDRDQKLDKLLKIYRISKSEYDKITALLGHPLKGLEWPLFSALWSEHCSYKSSKVHLRKFYSKNHRVHDAEGENAGVIDLGENEKVAFKMESHNHPSFISPHQGAATGVGGILRDIFTMGARPIALGNYLCFGEPKADRMTALVDGVVRGIADYGNCVGVPMLTGQTNFHASYNGNILVNAFALGYFGKDNEILSSKAHGVGNFVVYVGAKTGKDGVHGASMASESFDEDSESKKPTVQIGDPFYEKLLIEGCLEVMKLNLVEAIQDMGAAGLTSSSFEMAHGGGVGFHLHLDQVPSRDADITAEEILLSESQERMLLLCKPENYEKVKAVFSKWDLDAEKIGEVVNEKEISLFWNKECLLKIDPDILVENAPRYERSFNLPQYLPSKDISFSKLSLKEGLEKIYSHVEGASKNWVYEQYDQRVGARTARDCSQSVGILELPESKRALGIVLGCRPSIMRMQTHIGGADSLIYPSLELAIKGFEPLALTDCLNFGNPEKPDLMGEFVATVESLSEACKALDVPVISGNVSLYNETLNKNVTSTPSTGVVGLRPSLNHIPFDDFQKEGLRVFVLRLNQVQTNGAIFDIQEKDMNYSGQFDFHSLNIFQKALQEISRNQWVKTSKISSQFGLAHTLSRMCLQHEVGFTFKNEDVFKDQGYFSHPLYEVIFGIDAQFENNFIDLSNKMKKELNDLEVFYLGQTGGSDFQTQSEKIEIKTLKKNFENSWRQNFELLA